MIEVLNVIINALKADIHNLFLIEKNSIYVMLGDGTLGVINVMEG